MNIFINIATILLGVFNVIIWSYLIYLLVSL